MAACTPIRPAMHLDLLHACSKSGQGMRQRRNPRVSTANPADAHRYGAERSSQLKARTSSPLPTTMFSASEQQQLHLSRHTTEPQAKSERVILSHSPTQEAWGRGDESTRCLGTRPRKRPQKQWQQRKRSQGFQQPGCIMSKI